MRVSVSISVLNPVYHVKRLESYEWCQWVACINVAQKTVRNIYGRREREREREREKWNSKL